MDNDQNNPRPEDELPEDDHSSSGENKDQTGKPADPDPPAEPLREMSITMRIIEVPIIYEDDFTDRAHEPLCKLMLEHYPCFATVSGPVFEEYFQDFNENLANELVNPMNNLLDNHKYGDGLKEKYPKWERWRKFYGAPPDPDHVDVIERYPFYRGTDEEWEAHVQEEYRLIRQFQHWELNRQQQFYDIIQPILLELYPEIPEMEGDAWLMYAIIVRDAYENWKSICEDLELVIEYKMPPESLYWESEKFRKLMGETDPELVRLAQENRDARIHATPLP